MGCSGSEDKKKQEVSVPAEPLMDGTFAETAPCQPILAITTRDIVGGEEKWGEMSEKYQEWSNKAYGKVEGSAGVPGFKTMAFCQDPNNKGRVIDLQWFNSINAFRGHIDPIGHTNVVMETMNVEAFWDKSEGHYYLGYAVGSFDQKATMGMTIPEMFGWSMFPMPMVAESRQYNGGFMNAKAISSQKPPLIILTECIIKGDKMEDYKTRFAAAADEAKKDEKVIAFYSTGPCHRLPLADPHKTALLENKVVNVFAFEELAQFEQFWPSIAALSDDVEVGPAGCIWGDTAEETAKAKEVIGPCTGDITQHQSWLGVSDMVVCPPFGEGSVGHSDHTYNCTRTEAVDQAAFEKACHDGKSNSSSCSIM